MTEQFPVSRASRFDPLGASWRFLAAPQTLVVLMGFLAVVLIAGTLIPQISPGVEDDPHAWLAAPIGFWDQQSSLLRALGFYDIYHAPWFYVLLALLGLCLFVRLVESLELAWQATVRRTWTLASFAFWGLAGPQERLSSGRDLTTVHSLIHHFFDHRGYRWTDVPGLKSTNAVATRRELALWSRSAMLAGLIVALLSLAVTGSLGWQNRDWQPTPGESRGVGHGTPYAVRLDAFQLAPSGSGRETGFASKISWLIGEVSAGQDTVRTAQPATFRGLTVRQIGYVPVVRIGVSDEKGFLGLQPAGAESSFPGEVEVVFPSLDAQPLILIPGQGRFLALSYDAECSGTSPSLHVAILRDDGEGLLLSERLSQSGSLSGEGLHITVDLSYRPILRVDYRPAMALALAGLALAAAGFVVGYVLPSRLMWIAIQADDEEDTHIQLLVPAAGWGRRWLRQAAAQLQEELAGDD